MTDPTPDELLTAYVRIFKQLPRTTAAELLVEMGTDDAFAPSSQIMQAALLTVAGNRLFGAPENGTAPTRDDLIVAAAKALWEREFSTYEECSHTWSEMPRIAAVALDAAGLAEPAPTRWAYDRAVQALEKHRARADKDEAAIARVREHAEQWASRAPADDWGNTPADTYVADAGRAVLSLLDGPSAAPEEQTGGGEAEPEPGTYWERAVLERFVTGGPVDMATVRQQVAVLLSTIPTRQPPRETGGDNA